MIIINCYVCNQQTQIKTLKQKGVKNYVKLADN